LKAKPKIKIQQVRSVSRTEIIVLGEWVIMGQQFVAV